MKFVPKTEKEIAEENLWPAGEYSFEIIEAEDKVSKSGNEMIELTLRVFNSEGGFKIVNDYLLEAISYKLRHAAEVCGLLDNYNRGHLLANDFFGKTGFVKLKIDKDKEGKYPDKNGIADYITERSKSNGHAAPVKAAAKSQDTFQDDTIPF
jgi:hypothetical protein